MYAAELVMGLTEEDDPHPELFRSLLGTLRDLAGDGRPIECVARFQADLLNALGYAPNFEHCIGCGRPREAGAPAFFSSTAGGLICRDCEIHYVDKLRLPNGPG